MSILHSNSKRSTQKYPRRKPAPPPGLRRELCSVILDAVLRDLPPQEALAAVRLESKSIDEWLRGSAMYKRVAGKLAMGMTL